MDSSNIHRIVASPMAEFRIRLNKTEFSLNSELVVAQSPSLNNIINHHQGRSNDRPIIWKHVDISTFIRFSEIAFTGDYNGPEPRPRQVPAMVFRSRLLHKTKKIRLTNSANIPLCGYSSFIWKSMATRYGEHEFSSDGPVDSRTHSLADVFLCHARVFISPTATT